MRTHLSAALLALILPMSFIAPANAAEDTSRVLVAASEDGAAFDLDEYAGSADRSEITVTITDSAGTPVTPADGEVLRYFWIVEPFSDAIVEQDNSTTRMADDSPRGISTYDVVLPVEEGSGRYHLLAALADADTPNSEVRYRGIASYTAGQAAVQLDGQPQRTFEPAPGTEQEKLGTVTGAVVLEDGTPLPGRAVQLTYLVDPESSAGEDTDARLAVDQEPDGSAREGSTVVSRTTDAEGRFAADLVLSRVISASRVERGVVQGSAIAIDDGADGSDGRLGDPEPSTELQTVIRYDDYVVCRCGGYPVMSLRGRDNGARADRLLLRTGRFAAGDRVRLVKVRAHRRNIVVARTRLNEFGNARFVIEDRNGRRRTQYRAFLLPTDDRARAVSNRRVVR